jgi:coenzyme F420-dependent glucose-6-phosphate dehydrogenase
VCSSDLGMVTVEQIAESIPCGPNPAPVLEQARTYLDAGFDHVYFHQVGPDQQGFIEFAKRELLPELTKGHSGQAAPAA